ncbi:DUF2179 domain-containing protein [Mycoplasmatota bacterium]|nr:DUF2179 domain-containing protein [Mycoplasmatota bacterium]
MILNVFIDFFTDVSFWELLFIFFAKIIEVSIGTIRLIMVTKGYKKIGSGLAFIEVLLWVFVASVVIQGVTETPIKGVIYSIGFAVGVYIGSMIENRLAVGKVEIHVISSKPNGLKIVKALRDKGYGVTALDAYGKDDARTLLLIYANRKNKEKLFKLVTDVDEKALIVAQEVSLIQNGHVIPARRIAK